MEPSIAGEADSLTATSRSRDQVTWSATWSAARSVLGATPSGLPPALGPTLRRAARSALSRPAWPDVGRSA